MVLRHLLKTDVALYDIGTRLPGKHQMHSLARYRTQRIWGHHLHPAASFCPTQPIALWGLFKFYQSFSPIPDPREHFAKGVRGNESRYTLIWECLIKWIYVAKTSTPQWSLNGYANPPSKVPGCDEFANVNVILKNTH